MGDRKRKGEREKVRVYEEERVTEKRELPIKRKAKKEEKMVKGRARQTEIVRERLVNTELSRLPISQGIWLPTHCFIALSMQVIIGYTRDEQI